MCYVGKKSSYEKYYLLITLIICSFSALGQNEIPSKQDIIIKTNGEEMKGKLIQVTDSDVHFVYAGETAEYIIKKADISKITHASGRIETFSQPALPDEDRKNDQVTMTATPADHHNKIAILPFSFLLDLQAGVPEIGLKAQYDTYAFLSKHAAGYTILDTRTTNALLGKAGVTHEKMIGFTMKEICDILGVEYVIDGTIAQNKGYQTSSSSGSSSTAIKRDGDDKVKGVNNYGSNNSYSAQRYDVSVSLNIYMDNNASIYNQSHKAFFSSTDGAYSSPLEYLLKRCPLYRK